MSILQHYNKSVVYKRQLRTTFMPWRYYQESISNKTQVLSNWQAQLQYRMKDAVKSTWI